MVKPIPDGYHSVTPTLTISGASDAIEFYKKAFDAKEIYRFPGPDGKSIMHILPKGPRTCFSFQDGYLNLLYDIRQS